MLIASTIRAFLAASMSPCDTVNEYGFSRKPDLSRCYLNVGPRPFRIRVYLNVTDEEMIGSRRTTSSEGNSSAACVEICSPKKAFKSFSC